MKRGTFTLAAGGVRLAAPRSTSEFVAASSATLDAPAPSRAIERESETEKFNWHSHWYPVAFLKDLDDSAPVPFTLLGEPLVFWKDLAGAWHAVADRCPHRLVPLSEGRVDEEGRLECGYHGWAFNGAGACERIPQEREPERTRACASPRACATAFPTAVAQGMLFVLPTPTAKAPATLPPLPTLPELEEEGWVVMDIARDLPYDYATLLENVMDVSHVPFTHHLTVGNRANAAPVDLELRGEGVQPAGFEGFWQEGPRRGALGSQATRFEAPTLMAHTLTAKTFGTTMTVVYATPTLPGRCRLLARFPFKFSSPVPSFVIKNTPRWFNHQGQNAVLEDDQVFLHVQERVVEAELAEGRSYAAACYMPTAADVYVNAFRRWLGLAGGGPDWARGVPRKLPPAAETREALLDRYNSHTKHCVACMGALRNVRAGRAVAVAVAAAALLLAAGSLAVAAATAGAAAAASPAGLLRMAAGGLTAAVAAVAAWLKLGEIETKFLVGPYPPPRNKVNPKARKQLVARGGSAPAKA